MLKLSTKPPKQSLKGISGHAVQVWCFLRMLPLLIGDKITDTTDPAWMLLLSLRSVVELVCKPTYSMSDVVLMNEAIEEYLIMRTEQFPFENLKPKHHYLAHYPHLTIQCGPLIRLWTLRFESKHSYFKKCIKSANNFINVTRSLSEKHQLLQALYSAGSLFRHPLSYSSTLPFEGELLTCKIQEALLNAAQQLNKTNTVICSKIRFNGVTYKKDLIVLLSKDSQIIPANFSCGKIKIILLYENHEILFIVENGHLNYMLDTEVYKIETPVDNKYSCVSLSALLDIYPLESYLDSQFLVLKHAV